MKIKNAKLRNLGSVSMQWLNKIGVYTLEDLQKIRVQKAYQLLLDAGHEENLNMYYSLTGAIEDKDWREVAYEMQSEKKFRKQD